MDALNEQKSRLSAEIFDAKGRLAAEKNICRNNNKILCAEIKKVHDVFKDTNVCIEDIMTLKKEIHTLSISAMQIINSKEIKKATLNSQKQCLSALHDCLSLAYNLTMNMLRPFVSVNTFNIYILILIQWFGT